MWAARVTAAVLLLGLAGRLAADEPVAQASATSERPHCVYLELLGKGGLWGLGWDVQLGRRLGVGAAASYTILDGERILSVSPYLAAYPLGGGRHRWFVHAGPQLVHVAIPSPVPEWDGTSATGLGIELSTGWEYRDGVVVRAYGLGLLGEGGAAPWLGVSVGWTL